MKPNGQLSSQDCLNLVLVVSTGVESLKVPSGQSSLDPKHFSSNSGWLLKHTEHSYKSFGLQILQFSTLQTVHSIPPTIVPISSSV